MCILIPARLRSTTFFTLQHTSHWSNKPIGQHRRFLWIWFDNMVFSTLERAYGAISWYTSGNNILPVPWLEGLPTQKLWVLPLVDFQIPFFFTLQSYWTALCISLGSHKYDKGKDFPHKQAVLHLLACIFCSVNNALATHAHHDAHQIINVSLLNSSWG